LKTLALSFAALLISFHAVATPTAPIPINPDPKTTPGEFCDENDKDFQDFRYKEKMAYCKRNVSKGLKNHIYEMYHIPKNCHGSYTIDHFVPLALGGNNALENLWPEHKLVKATRQEMEQDLYNQVSEGTMTSEDAVKILIQEKMKLVLDLSTVDGCG
jgi:hypothetical protein